MDRRQVLAALAGSAAFSVAGTDHALAATAKRARPSPFAPGLGPRCRVMYTNDLAGDIDGLFSAVHMVLSPSVSLRGLIGTGTGPGEAQKATDIAAEMLTLMGKTGQVTVYRGSERKCENDKSPVASPGVQAIIDEAMRTDTTLPLYVTAGGGLTEVASALMLKPEIASKFTLLWIGGSPYPGGKAGETNFGIDPVAARFIFNETNVRIWQIPSNVYMSCQISDTEIQAYVAPCGPIGAWLYSKIFELSKTLGDQVGLNTGETWLLGDSPLVQLTALTDWVPNTAIDWSSGKKDFPYEGTGSSFFDEIYAPILNADGTYTARQEGRKIRVYNSVDTREMFSDFFAKMKINYGQQ